MTPNQYTTNYVSTGKLLLLLCEARFSLQVWHKDVRRLIQWLCSIKGYTSDTNPRPVTLLHQKALVNNRLWHIVRVGRPPHVFWNDRHIDLTAIQKAYMTSRTEATAW